MGDAVDKGALVDTSVRIVVFTISVRNAVLNYINKYFPLASIYDTSPSQSEIGVLFISSHLKM